ncbi:MAG: DUF3887 domain-containing protein [Desulfomonile sp.]|nr:DUF3887 domain-containing protein [Desulfomonile sp.]
MRFLVLLPDRRGVAMAREIGKQFVFAWITIACLLIAPMRDSAALSMFLPIPPRQVDQAAKAKAQQAAERLLTGWREGKFAPLPDEFTVEMAANFPPEDQQAAHNNLKALFGELRSLEFAEAVSSPTLAGHVIYRFRGKFSATDADPEVRVLMNNEGKIAGFWVRHWMDEVH